MSRPTVSHRIRVVASVFAAAFAPAIAGADLHYDAQILALDYSRELTPAPALVQAIESDLSIIFNE